MRARGLLALAIVLAACAQGAGDPVEPGPQPIAPITALPRALTEAEQQVIERSNAFAFDLFRAASASRDSNSFISPLSVSMALGMTMNGAAGNTLDEMREVLGFGGLDMPAVNAGYRGLVDLLRGLDPSSEMRIANAVWMPSTVSPDPQFRGTVGTFFDAPVRSRDFGDPATLQEINAWVDTATNGRIASILDHLDDRTGLFLANAVYFKAGWVQPFDPALTTTRPFAAGAGGAQSVATMRSERIAHAASRPDADVVELRYGNEAFAMDLILPPVGADIHDLIDSLTPARWGQWMGALQPRKVDLALPRIRIAYARELGADLVQLGMQDAFNDLAADFRYFFSPNTPSFHIAFVKHKTFLEVDEEGTEAAAVTGVGGVRSGAAVYHFDRPFVMVIRERFSGAILFVGKFLRIPE